MNLQGIAKAIDGHVDLCSEPSSAPTKGLRCLPTPFFGCARSRMMGPDYSAVDDQVLHVSVMDEMLMHSFPYSAIAPSGESFVDAVPVTILGREQPPWGPRTCSSR